MSLDYAGPRNVDGSDGGAYDRGLIRGSDRVLDRDRDGGLI